MTWSAGVEVTKGCNFRCSHCMVDAGRRHRGELSTAELLALLSALAREGCDFVGWSGGEALIRRDLEELTARCSVLGISTSLATNGYLATRARLAALRDAGLDAVQVSLDGPDRARAERFRKGPKDAFERAVRAVRTSAALGLHTVICCVLAPETAPEVDEMIAFARKLNARQLRYTFWAPFGRAAGQAYDEVEWGAPAMRRFLRVAERYRRSKKLEVTLDCPTGPLPGASGFDCHAGRGVVYVCSTGEVYPCTALMTPKYLVGNVRERPLGELLRDAKMTAVHEERRVRAGGACARCDIVDACGGGCPGRPLAAHGAVRGAPKYGECPACLRRLHG